VRDAPAAAAAGVCSRVDACRALAGTFQEKRMSTSSSRRAALRALLLAPVVLAAHRAADAQSTPPIVEVWKSPTCGCCNDWIRHLEANGFKVTATNVPDSRLYRARFGMPARLGSCHTAVVGGCVVEGHVPAREIRRLLRERPGALGLSVPGMPVGSPGMDGPEYNGQVDPYDVLLVQPDGSARVYASYEGR
jgi:hypothetical protein